MWTIGKVLDWATADFRARGIENPRLDADVLLAFALGENRVKLIIDRDRPLSQGDLGRFRELVRRRRAHEPVAYLTGTKEFYGRPFRVDGRVLIPRPDTEALVDAALARTTHVSMCLRALDLCTGSGCVGVTLARERPTSRVHLTDTSDAALAVARENAQRLGAYNVSFARADLLDGLDPAIRFDAIVANPPYVPSAEIQGLARDIQDYEPRTALDGGDDGLELIRRIIERAPALLRPRGTLALEVGAGQAASVSECFVARGFDAVARTKDYAGIERVVAGRWPS
jgi:release factor glutamine methyltransferase